MKISIITVCRNAERNIKQCLESVGAQQKVEVEHLIVDGASTDQTTEIVRRANLPHVSFNSESDHGIYDAMNKGIRRATGEIVGVLNADDFYAHAGVLARVAEAFGDSGVESCYADLDYVDAHDPDRVVRAWRSRSFMPGLFRRGWMPAHPTFFVRRSVYEKQGGFDTSFRLAADFELTMRFLEIARISSCYIPEVWVKMRTGGATNRSWQNIWRGNWESYRACQKNGLRVTPFFIIQKILSRLPQFLAR